MPTDRHTYAKFGYKVNKYYLIWYTETLKKFAFLPKKYQKAPNPTKKLTISLPIFAFWHLSRLRTGTQAARRIETSRNNGQFPDYISTVFHSPSTKLSEKATNLYSNRNLYTKNLYTTFPKIHQKRRFYYT